MESIFLDGSDTDSDWDFLEHEQEQEHGFNGPSTPSTTSDSQHEAEQRHLYDSSEGESEGTYDQPVPRPKKGGYDSRIEQILYEDPNRPILIVDAGKSVESGGKYIVYTIQTGVCAPAPHLEPRLMVD